jgi:hypothetical protein
MLTESGGWVRTASAGGLADRATQEQRKLTLDSFDLSLDDDVDDVKQQPLLPWAPELFLLLLHDSFCWCVCCCWCALVEVPEQGDGATLPDETDDSEGPDRSRLNSRLLLTSFSF